jgi:hypothetical protein
MALLYVQGVLKHKRALLNILKSGDGNSLMTFPCALSNASIGQHLRHSLNHMRTLLDSSSPPTTMNRNQTKPTIVSYDHRIRGTDLETNVITALKEVESLIHKLNQSTENSESENNHISLDQCLSVSFMMDQSGREVRFDSNMDRELAFVAHHGIHHNAVILMMIKSNPQLAHLLDPLLKACPGFGKAPSTLAHELDQQQ